MKQKFVLKVQMTCRKCRTKAFEIAASADGVNSVAIQGKDQDQVVVIGDGVDPISLICLLRKKVGPTEVVTVEEVKPKDKKRVKIEVKELPYRCYPKFVTYEPVYEPDPPYCSIIDQKREKIEVIELPYRCYPKFVTYEPVYEPDPPYCSIM